MPARRRRRGAEVTIVSSDKDLMQLVGDRAIAHARPDQEQADRRRRGEEKFGVGPDKVVDVQALAGDSTDNVPGVPGIGVKTAAELINDLWRSRDPARPRRRDQAAEAARGAACQNAEKARISRAAGEAQERRAAADMPLDAFAR